ncbi:glycosyltransferase family 32 protein [Halomonas elongata]|uniref:glycosyltransferase family 32 protein n=1 Tax=Halomonas elongata TaxID=2746 RepID=UPI0023B0500F|nr:glycosyltransferase [Halomonas elongata]
MTRHVTSSPLTLSSFSRFIVGRLLKLMGNVFKLMSYPFHWLLPDKRFTLPAHAAPLIRPRRPCAVPRTLWQTNFTDRVTLPVYLNYLCNRLMAPTFEYRFVSTRGRSDFIAANYPAEVHRRYSRLRIGAAQADFWRVLVLQACGGVYMDIDAHLVWPLHRILGAEREVLFVRSRKGGLSNYFIASRPGTAELQAVSEAIGDHIAENRGSGVFDLTGPGVFNRVIDAAMVESESYRFLCLQGSFTNERFQYVDKPEGKWTREQKAVGVLHRDGDATVKATEKR